MEQPDLFTGAELRDFGIAAAEHQRRLVIESVDHAIRILGETRPLGFTAEDVRTRLSRPVADLEDVSKVIGGRMRAAALRGDIFTRGESVTASRPSAHARRMLVWYRKMTVEEVQR